MNDSLKIPARRRWPDYAALWRWHFYAGLFCLPFFCWLAITGSLYLFRPDIEAWLDRPYESLHLEGPRATPASEARAAVAAVPGSVFSHYEPPATATGAAQVVVAREGYLYRVYVHPGSLQAMHVGRDDHRIMELMSHLHGNLLLGTPGSMIVEMVGSWGVIMILTGVCLWFPRGTKRLGGLLYPRLRGHGRLFWRDLHSVTGVWICAVTLFLLLSGLPWAASWGSYFTWVRNHWTATAGKPDWSLGGKEEPIPTMAHDMHMSHMASPNAKSAISAAEMAAMRPPATGKDAMQPPLDLDALSTVVPVAAGLGVPRPLWILPPSPGERDWIVSSRNQDRTQRVSYAIDPNGAVSGRKVFGDDDAVNRTINVAISAHEGHLFGRPNQAILLLNAIGVLLVAISSAVMWWRRRPAHLLGAPRPGASPRTSALLALGCALLVLTVLLPLFGASLLLILLLERLVLPRRSSLRRWLGLGAGSA
ncbi:MAG TPA: PepSY domain-containing protein [Dyella sp.]|uniref:PepSY-associated TM helix domain-containing protein n=1 Tax=Dyella sp. TaxID=1869338 RepID=UPI002D770CA7|nr:PepSY domain-containing protein [Dyella sp.]HET6553074.1 PepSY domain-containing protein [Dyella sp.]